ncbi:MAG TPA: hypothetical protein PLL78_01475 [Fimbriimonadaceae bacterium]|nr:hypothetical protein [Fimbriimonadaceae bacterium]HRJ95330.1 hypothetical protein [Fimbriimonadaceae bacterium]
MSTIALVFVTALGLQSKMFNSPELDLSFQHPANWKVIPGKKGDTKLEIPLAGGGKATLEIFSVAFREPAERWQEYQLMANQNLKRTVDRQWQEEVLGSPLLMTRIFYTVKAEPMATLVGLMYRSHPKKLNFRLTASSSVYEEAERSWREALQSLRTMSGSMPEAENPDRIVDTPIVPPKVEKPKPQVTFSAKGPTPSKLYRGPVKVSARAAGKDILLLLPDGWRADPDGDAFILTRKGFNGVVRMEVAGTLDSPPAQRALLASAAKTLGEFAQVTMRDESRPVTTKAGALLQIVRREGRSMDGGLVILHASGASGDYYWLLTYRANDPKHFRRDSGSLDSLMNGASVVLAP